MPSATKVQTGYLEAVNPFSLADGTASAPAITFTSSSATGMFSPSTGDLAFSTGSTQNALTITNDGNVGIGTTNPQGQLHISSGTSGDCKLILEADTDNNVEGDNPYIIFRQDGGIDEAAIWQGNTTGNNDNSLNLANANNQATLGGIRFLTTNASAVYTDAVERMCITTGGNVGIGTTNPTTNLHLFTSAVSGFSSLPNFDKIIVENGTSSQGATLQLVSNATNGVSEIGFSDSARNRGLISYQHSTDSFRFHTSATEVACILSSGNTGIGTTNPTSKLQVHDGILKVENNVNAENAIFLRNTNTTGVGAYSVIRFSQSQDAGGGNSGDAYIHFFNSGYGSNGFWDANSLASGTVNGNVNFSVGGNNTFKIWTNGSPRLYVLGNGNVGIGTTTPGKTLTVNGAIESLTDGVSEGGALILRATPRAGGGATQYRWNIDSYDQGTRGADRMRFVRENDTDGSSGVEALSINTSGDLQFRTAGTKFLNTSGNTILRQSGSVIQVVTNTITASYNLSATTETVIYNPMITITPTNSTSLIFFDIQFYGYHNTVNDFYTSLWVRRNSAGNAISSSYNTVSWGDWTRNFGSMVAYSAHADYHFSCWDFPGTTSAVNYLLTGINHSVGKTFTLWHGSGSSNMRITAFEVAQ